MRALLHLFAVAAAVAILGFAERPELLAGGGLLLVGIACAIHRTRPGRVRRRTRDTIEVMPLQAPRGLEEDLEGKTVPARMSDRAAYEMHARYAPAFDLQLALDRHIARHGDEQYAPADPEPAGYDPERYAQARAYAEAFDRQLAEQRRTRPYAVAPPGPVAPPPRRVARGSYPAPGLAPYAPAPASPEPAPLEPEPDGWDPHRPPSVTAMRRAR